MSKRVILITGSNGGLGRAIARSFLEEQEENFLFLGIRENKKNAEEILSGFPNRCRLVELDVTCKESWEKTIAHIKKSAERLDVLVNNAGRHEDSLLANMTSDAWNSVLASNLSSVFLGSQAVLPMMISQRHGRIVNIASLSALLAPPGQTNYAAAKAGVVALSQSLAKEVARIGITVNTVCPGYIETELVAGMGKEERTAAAMRVPMRRFGKPEEVAAAVVFLACSKAAYITGSVLKIDGGVL